MDRNRYWRYGNPRTEAERRRRHYERFGTYDLPPRGTGRSISEEVGYPPLFGDRGRIGWGGVRVSGEYTDQFVFSVIGGLGIALGLFLAHKLSGGAIGRR